MLGQEDIIITIVDNGSTIVIVDVKDYIKEAYDNESTPKIT